MSWSLLPALMNMFLAKGRSPNTVHSDGGSGASAASRGEAHLVRAGPPNHYSRIWQIISFTSGCWVMNHLETSILFPINRLIEFRKLARSGMSRRFLGGLAII